MAGPLFREMAEDLAKIWNPCLLYTGHPDTLCYKVNEKLHIQPSPEYKRRNYFTRIISWINYFISSLKIIKQQPKNALIFIVSNPPFLGLAGLLVKRIRGQRYIILVYDIYPDLLIGLGRLKNGFFAGLWDFLNCLVYENASQIITIGQDMANRLEKKFDVSKTDGKKIVSIPCWADVETIKPLPKSQNWFAVKYKILNRTTILYSGNMGHTHDIESVIEVARKLQNKEDIHFLFIGEGAKWLFIEKKIKEFDLKNITLLPFQPENVLPYSMASADIGIVAYQKGTESCILPSKTYYYMAAGLVPLIVSDQKTDLTEMVQQKKCGIWIKNKDIEGMSKIIAELHNNKKLLEYYKIAARKTAEKFYSRKNTEKIAGVLKNHVF